jgi:hypothetical protein
MESLNKAFGVQLVNHGAQDDWDDKMKEGPNRGPQPPVTAYLPSGSVQRIDAGNYKTMKEGKERDKAKAKTMKDFYIKNNLTWPYGDDF